VPISPRRIMSGPLRLLWRAELFSAWFNRGAAGTFRPNLHHGLYSSRDSEPLCALLRGCVLWSARGPEVRLFAIAAAAVVADPALDLEIPASRSRYVGVRYTPIIRMRGTADLGEAFASLHPYRHIPVPSRKIPTRSQLGYDRSQIGSRHFKCYRCYANGGSPTRILQL
jgi:hypothetical protein